MDLLFELFSIENVLGICFGIWVLDIFWPDDGHDDFNRPIRKDPP